jgi:predicted nucleic acid-binding protein
LKSLVLDCSVVLAWLHNEGPEEYVRGILEMIKKGAIVYVPPIWLYELTNGLVMATRRQQISHEKLQEFLDELSSYPIRFHAPDNWNDAFDDVHDAVASALANKLTAYDNAYLLTALQLRLPLASLDRELRHAAKAAGIADALKV